MPLCKFVRLRVCKFLIWCGPRGLGFWPMFPGPRGPGPLARSPIYGVHSATVSIWGRVGPGAPGGPWAQIWCTRGERILHDSITHLILIANGPRPLVTDEVWEFGGESGPGPLGAPGPRYGVPVLNVYPMVGYTWKKVYTEACSLTRWVWGESRAQGPWGPLGPDMVYTW